MDTNILISIIVPVYNQENYLNKSITSLMNQKYRNIEIVIIDDGSKDDSYKIMQQYAESDKRIRIMRKDNGGLISATICGIQNSKGKYIAFVDPDDYVDSCYISNYINELDDDYDFIATGFFQNKSGVHTPYFLKEDKVYTQNELVNSVSNLIIDDNGMNVSNRFFISRWNKIYKRKTLISVIEKFKDMQQVSLGEDSIFTLLVIRNSYKAKTLRYANSYFYNISNTDSMMKKDSVDSHLEKSRVAFMCLSNLLAEEIKPNYQGYALYFFLIESIFQRTLELSKESFMSLYRYLSFDPSYKKALSYVFHKTSSRKMKIDILARQLFKSPTMYLHCYNFTKRSIKDVYLNVLNARKYFINACRHGVKYAKRQHKFQHDRKVAFSSLYDSMPLLEERISEIIKPFIGLKTINEYSANERNIFIFWWDGFDFAPEIVKKCLMSVKRYNQDANIIEITKDTYHKYSSINEKIEEDFINGIISIQTFSDILRFNLLLNHGGLWIDSTIMFLQKFDLLSNLNEKVVESICFSSTKNFLKYGGEYCTWSGFFFAARKDSIFLQTMNSIFEKYYILYNSYTTYFFIDAALMICKINRIDDNALGKIQTSNYDMFMLSKALSEEYCYQTMNIFSKIPQKLSWFYNTKMNKANSFYSKL